MFSETLFIPDICGRKDTQISLMFLHYFILYLHAKIYLKCSSLDIVLKL